jgi:hypothetical protein
MWACPADVPASGQGFRRRRSKLPFSGIWDVKGMGMKETVGSPRVHLASSVSNDTLAANLQARLRATLATLEQCQASLANDAEHDTADLLSVAILQLRMKLKGVTDSELKLLCEVQAAQAQASRSQKAPRGTRRRGRPVLKLVK